MSKLLVDEISDADNTGPVTVTDGLIGDVTGNLTGNVTGNINGLTPQASNMQPFNRIINGAMTIDQRNAGASTNNAGSVATYTLDRWLYYGPSSSKFAIQQSSTAPVDFVNSLLITSSAATSMSANNQYLLRHAIEGYNIADLNWGSANAKTVTLSFWVRSSLTGAFGGSVTNSDVNRSYPFSYTILLANTWEQKSVTITGPTDGSWNITNGTGLRLYFALGAGSDYNGTAGAWATVSDVTYPTGSTNILGTDGATFYITGVQLEAGSSASSFAHENYADTLQKCQRYYYQIGGGGGEYGFIGIASRWDTNIVSYVGINHPQPMRGVPSLSYTGDIYLSFGGTGTLLTSLGEGYYNRENFRLWQQFNHGAIGSQGQCGIVYCQTSSGFLKFDAEL